MTTARPDPMVDIVGLRFAWPKAPDCLAIDALAVPAGQALFLHGPSGCGKSTLLSLLAGVMLPREGRIVLAGQDWAALGSAQRDRFRAAHIGYVFQQFNLLPWLSALDNVRLGCRFSALRQRRAGDVEAAARALLSAFGLDDAALLRRPAAALSVGQQQRVAAARALVGSPDVVIADEPTSALDAARREAFMDTLLAQVRAAGSTLVFVSHDERLAQRFDRLVELPALNRAAAVGASA